MISLPVLTNNARSLAKSSRVVTWPRTSSCSWITSIRHVSSESGRRMYLLIVPSSVARNMTSSVTWCLARTRSTTMWLYLNEWHNFLCYCRGVVWHTAWQCTLRQATKAIIIDCDDLSKESYLVFSATRYGAGISGCAACSIIWYFRASTNICPEMSLPRSERLALSSPPH